MSFLKAPLVVGRTYVDRKLRRWRVLQISNAGNVGSVCLPAMALCVCLDRDAETQHRQWFFVDTGTWSLGAHSLSTTSIDLMHKAIA